MPHLYLYMMADYMTYGEGKEKIDVDHSFKE